VLLSTTLEERARNLQTTQNNANATRGTLLAGMIETKFHGASGTIDFGKEVGKERNAETIAIGLYNIRPGNLTGLGKQSFYASLVYSNNDSEWVQQGNEAIIYRDGTTRAPEIKRAFVENNYLSPGVRAIGMTLMAIAWVLGFTALIGLHIFNKDSVVQRAQPFFLKILCYGSVLTSSAIFTLSWDEGAGWSDRQLDIACAMTPWFFFVGIILTFCALFTKLWRVDKVLQFRRRAVTISNVMKPW
jgi:7 transmembrane sweet-taste receptor of 3 GCPR